MDRPHSHFLSAEELNAFNEAVVSTIEKLRTPIRRSRLDPRVVRSELELSLYKYGRRYDPAKGTRAQYITKIIFNIIKKSKEKRRPSESVPRELGSSSKNPAELMQQRERARLLRMWLELGEDRLSPDQVKFLKLCEGHTQGDAHELLFGKAPSPLAARMRGFREMREIKEVLEKTARNFFPQIVPGHPTPMKAAKKRKQPKRQ